MAALEAAVLQLVHLCTLGCHFQLSATQITGWINHPEEEHGRKKASSFWVADRLESLCLSIAGNLFSKVKFDRGQGLSISPWAAHCLSELGTNMFGNFLVLSLCYDRDAQASVCWHGVGAGHSWCWVMQEEMWLLALCLHTSYFLSSFSFLSIWTHDYFFFLKPFQPQTWL